MPGIKDNRHLNIVYSYNKKRKENFLILKVLIYLYVYPNSLPFILNRTSLPDPTRSPNPLLCSESIRFKVCASSVILSPLYHKSVPFFRLILTSVEQ